MRLLSLRCVAREAAPASCFCLGAFTIKLGLHLWTATIPPYLSPLRELHGTALPSPLLPASPLPA